MSVNSFLPLCKRIIEVCESQIGTGTGRVVPSGSFTFNSSYPGKDVDNLGRDTLYKPTFHIDGITLTDQNRLPENCSAAAYDAQIVLRMSFNLPSNLIPQETTIMNAKILDTIHVVRRALSDPSNLLASSDGSDTGLSSGMLNFLYSTNPDFNYNSGVVSVNAVFSAFIWIDYV